MAIDTVEYLPIGRILSPFTKATGMPIQPSAAKGVQGRVVIQAQFQSGLKDLDGFSHLILIYDFDRVEEYKLTVTQIGRAHV